MSRLGSKASGLWGALRGAVATRLSDTWADTLGTGCAIDKHAPTQPTHHARRRRWRHKAGLLERKVAAHLQAAHLFTLHALLMPLLPCNSPPARRRRWRREIDLLERKVAALKRAARGDSRGASDAGDDADAEGVTLAGAGGSQRQAGLHLGVQST